MDVKQLKPLAQTIYVAWKLRYFLTMIKYKNLFVAENLSTTGGKICTKQRLLSSAM
jgi:hypothetical protein